VLLKATGQSGHAAFPEGTRNAILLLATALAAAELVDGPDLAAARAVAQILATPYGHGTGIEYEDEESGRLTQNGGIIEPTEGGLLLHLDIRYSVTADPEELLAKITTAADEHGGHLHETRVSNRVYVAKDSPEVQLLQGAIGDVLGGTPEPYSMGGGTHSRVLPHSITFGPGFGSASEFLPAHIRDREPDFLGDGHKGAHGPNEYVDVDALFQALRIYLVTLLRLDAFLGDD
jgi:succinyl-diaminopimelate desuccinylase